MFRRGATWRRNRTTHTRFYAPRSIVHFRTRALLCSTSRTKVNNKFNALYFHRSSMAALIGSPVDQMTPGRGTHAQKRPLYLHTPQSASDFIIRVRPTEIIHHRNLWENDGPTFKWSHYVGRSVNGLLGTVGVSAIFHAAARQGCRLCVSSSCKCALGCYKHLKLSQCKIMFLFLSLFIQKKLSFRKGVYKDIRWEDRGWFTIINK